MVVHRQIKFVYGFDLLYAIAGGRMVFDYGNAMTDLNHVPSSMPVTGVALPFISYGGTSLIIFMAAVGIVLNVSKHVKMN